MAILGNNGFQDLITFRKAMRYYPGAIDAPGFYSLYGICLGIVLKPSDSFKNIEVDLLTTDKELAQSIVDCLYINGPSAILNEYKQSSVVNSIPVHLGANGNYHVSPRTDI